MAAEWRAGKLVGVREEREKTRASGEVRVPLRITYKRRWRKRGLIVVEAHGERGQWTLESGQSIDVDYTLTLG